MSKRICLWSGPRNISTALMYSFAQRKDTTVVDEPLYAHYLSSTDAKEYHPGADEVIADQENDGQKVVDEIILGEYETPIVFFKHMTHHLVDLDLSFLKDTINIILTRDPREMLPSYSKQVKQPKITDTGYPQHLELLKYLREVGQNPPVIDSKEILLNPEQQLKKLCQQLDIPFDKSMLNWEAGPRKEDGVWAKYWYDNVHRSTRFKPYHIKAEPLPEHLKELLSECEAMYNELLRIC